MDINDRRRESKRLKAEARSIMSDAEDAGRDMTAEEEQKFDRLMDQADKHDANVNRAERARDDDRDDAEQAARERGDRGQRDERSPAERAFSAYLRGGRSAVPAELQRALVAGNDPEGGFLVAPMQFVTELLKGVDDMVDIRRLATVRRLTRAESLGIPTLDTDASDAEWTSEIGTGSDDDAMRFGRRELRPHPLAKRVKVSRKLIRNAAMDPEDIVRQRMEYKFGTTAENAYMTGDGNEKPLGLFAASTDGISTSRDVTIGTGGAIPLTTATSDQLIDAKYTLKAQYWSRARWLFHRDLVKTTRKIKESTTGQYIWQPGLAGDRPDTILEVPYTANEFVPNTVSANAYVGMIADFSFYHIADALEFEVQRLVELYAETNQVGFIGRLESDGMPVLEEAFVRLQVG